MERNLKKERLVDRKKVQRRRRNKKGSNCILTNKHIHVPTQLSYIIQHSIHCSPYRYIHVHVCTHTHLHVCTV